MEDRKVIMEETILFDLDGTLTDPKEGITRCVQYALESFGIHERDRSRLECFIGPPLKEMFMEYGGLSEEEGRKAVEKYRERFTPIGIFENAVYDGIADMLGKLKERGFRLGLATSKPEVYAKRILEHFGLSGYFDEVTGSELSGERTRKADVVREALRRMNAEADRTVMVGDRKHDVEGAHAAGVRCIGVLYGYGSRTELEAAGADWICENIEELGQVLMNQEWNPVYRKID